MTNKKSVSSVFTGIGSSAHTDKIRSKNDFYVTDPSAIVLLDKHGLLDKRLTPLECERLQAFPDNWTQYGSNDELISDTQRYKCIGNSVTTTVITHIINTMFEGCV